MLYCPPSTVMVVLAAFVAIALIVSSALVMTAPFGSVTTPVMFPYSDCAKMVTVANRQKIANASFRRHVDLCMVSLLIYSPLDPYIAKPQRSKEHSQSHEQAVAPNCSSREDAGEPASWRPPPQPIPKPLAAASPPVTACGSAPRAKVANQRGAIGVADQDSAATAAIKALM